MKKKQSQQQQLNLFEADTHFLVLLSSLVSDGTLRKIKPSGLAVLVVLRANAAHNNGEVYLGIPRISELAGVCDNTAKDAIKRLKDEGLVEVEDDGKGTRHRYKLKDLVPFRFGAAYGEREGEEAGKLEVPYVPARVGQTRNALLEFLQDGVLTEAAKKAGISLNITINITKIENAEKVYLASKSKEEILALPPSPYRDKILEWLGSSVVIEANTGNEDLPN